MTHVIRAATDMNDSTTIVSVDGIGAYDSISRHSMLEGLYRMVDGDRLCGCSTDHLPSVCGRMTWETHMKLCKEKDLLMPSLFCVGQHCITGNQCKIDRGRVLVRILGRVVFARKGQ